METIDYLNRLWKGDASFGITFWVYGVFILFFLRILEVVAEGASYAAGQAMFLFSLVYYFVYTIILWRTAGKVDHDFIYAQLARGFLILGWARYFISATFLGGAIG